MDLHKLDEKRIEVWIKAMEHKLKESMYIKTGDIIKYCNEMVDGFNEKVGFFRSLNKII